MKTGEPYDNVIAELASEIEIKVEKGGLLGTEEEHLYCWATSSTLEVLEGEWFPYADAERALKSPSDWKMLALAMSKAAGIDSLLPPRTLKK
jgi:hypothetical protein